MNFSVNTGQLKKASAEIQYVRAALLKTNADIDGIVDALYRQDSSYEIIVGKIRKYQGSLSAMSLTVGRFGEAATSAATQYKTTESLICVYTVIKMIKALLDNMRKLLEQSGKPGPYNVSSIVFDEEGSYGGDQGHPKGNDVSEARKQELFDLIRRNNPDLDLTDEQLNNYLKKINDEGCGYVALINTIFVAYEGREAEFEETFGYPMRYKGDLNYDMLLVDLYSTMDNRGANGKYHKYHDYNPFEGDGLITSYDPWNDTTGRGTKPEIRAHYIEKFMEDRGVDVVVKNDVKVTADNFRSISEGGKQVIVSYHDGNLLNMDGTVRQPINGGHAMVVTGVTNDGKLIVSSWGEKCMIDPNATGKTTITYSTIEYK